jgi:hypothetical protein
MPFGPSLRSALVALAVLVSMSAAQAADVRLQVSRPTGGVAADSPSSHDNAPGISGGAPQDGAITRHPAASAASSPVPHANGNTPAVGAAEMDGKRPYATAASELLDWLGPLKELTPGQRELRLTTDDSFLNPLKWNVTVYKSRHQLVVYYKGRMFKTYHAVFGHNSDGGKRWEGDLRTPEGVYTVVGKYKHPRWRWFLRLNYPNYVDRQRYDTMLHGGMVPAVHGQRRQVGSAIGIHGTDRPRFNRTDINWTSGCISVDNDSIVELDHLLPLDTLVIIKP